MDTYTFIDRCMKFVVSAGWLAIVTLALCWLRKPLVNLINRVTTMEIGPSGVKLDVLEQRAADVSKQAHEVLPADVRHEIMDHHHPITIETKLDVSEILNQVEKLSGVSTTAMIIEAYRVFELFLIHVLKQLNPDAAAWTPESLPSHAVNEKLLTLEQGEVLRQLREIRNDCTKAGRGAQLNEHVSHRYVIALREMACTIDKRARAATGAPAASPSQDVTES